MTNNEWKNKFHNEFVATNYLCCNSDWCMQDCAESTEKKMFQFISTLLAQARQETVREVIERIGKDKNRFQRFIKETNPSAINTLNGYETACNDLTEELREDYNIKDE